MVFLETRIWFEPRASRISYNARGYEKLPPSAGGKIVSPPERGGNLDREKQCFLFWIALDYYYH